MNNAKKGPTGKLLSRKRTKSWKTAAKREKVVRSVQQIREQVLEALESVGGAKYFAKIAESDPTVFCALIAKIIPRQLDIGGNGGAVSVKIVNYANEAGVMQRVGVADNSIGGTNKEFQMVPEKDIIDISDSVKVIN